MKRIAAILFTVLIVSNFLVILSRPLASADESVVRPTDVATTRPADSPTTRPTGWAPAVNPKPLSDNVKKGLAWLAKAQRADGGWGQGEESQQMGHGLDNLRDVSNVGDSCAAMLALIRAGSTPRGGPHGENVRRGLDFLCQQIEQAESDGMYITKVRGTRLQMKIGTYVDTFLAALVLAEVKDQMPDAKARTRIIAALDKVMDKIEKNQKPDGTWDDRGWAPVISQSMATKALNRVAQSGGDVDESVRARAEDYAGKGFDEKEGGFRGTGSAGVSLYAAAAAVGGMQDSANTNKVMADKLDADIKSGRLTETELTEARSKLERFRANETTLEQAKQSVVQKLDDKGFIAGFGSNGGEEFLSYMNIGESLVVKGGPEWEKWDKQITENLNRIQNADGSWTGHHCITGRNFCTSAALLVLTVDRAPVPLAAKMGRR